MPLRAATTTHLKRNRVRSPVQHGRDCLSRNIVFLHGLVEARRAGDAKVYKGVRGGIGF